MTTYKIGNKGNVLIRAYAAGQLGKDLIVYDNQPYTLIEEKNINISFQNKAENAKATTTLLRDSRSFLKDITISDVLLTPKILNLIFKKIETKLVSFSEKTSSDDDKKIYLSTNEEKIYQVFIFHNGELESAYGELEIEEGIEVEEANESYLVIYSYPSEKFTYHSLNMQNNFYLTLDIFLVGNENDNTSNMQLHIEKCSLVVDKNMNFSNGINTVDLTFTVMNDKGDESYLAL